MLLTQEDIINEEERRERIMKQYLFSPDYQNRLKQRIQIQDAGNGNVEARQHIIYLCQRPDDRAEGCIFFIENFGWTFSPKTEEKHLPFILFDFQKRAIREIVDHIDRGRDVLIEKSREMGVSWLVFCYIALWYWLFIDGTNGLLGSYKQDLVDNKTIDSLFGKIDYALESLPNWILPAGYSSKKHRTKLKLINPENGNVITGDTMNPNFGRGSRKTFIMFDELAFWDYAKDAWESSADSTNCRIANSTPNGYDYYAYLRNESGIDVLTLRWQEHPLKDLQWYNYECNRRTEEEVAQEIDISYSKSREGRVYPEWNDENIIFGKFDYDETLPLYVSWDFGRTDATAIIWAQPHRDGLRIVDAYTNTGKNIDFYVPFITGMIYGDSNYMYNKEELDIIGLHKNWKKATHFGDPAGRFQNNVTDDTVISVLNRYGIIVNFRDKWKEFKIRKHDTKILIMNKIFINDNKRTRYLNLCIINSSYPTVKVNGVGEVRSEKPKHDNNSHYRSCLEYLAIGINEISEQIVHVYDKFKKKDNIGRIWGGRRSIGY